MTVHIIAGRAKGRRLETLEGEATRPTTGKVRGALFSTLSGWVDGARWLDLYAGCGAVGLEAASRGAVSVVLVEQARPALEVIGKNIASTKLEGLEVWPMTVQAALPRLAGQQFNVIFLDPPYAEEMAPLLLQISQLDLVLPRGRLVLEHRSTRELPAVVGGLTKLKTARYGLGALSYYGHAALGEA